METSAAAERAYQHAKQLILTGSVQGGELLSEGVLAAELGISRTPVHEAFLRLDAEKLLKLSSRRGAAVVPMAPDEARDVLEMREAIELSTARRALADGPPSPEAIAELKANLERQRQLAAAGDIDGFVEADNEFHASIVRASRNQTALHFHDALRDRQHRLRRQLLHVGPENVAAALADHELMLAAAETGDAEEFCRLITQHVRRHRGIL
ncbi:GntR family transcriptional regulator [Paenarthrobacter sp. DKR-5]|uniref:GntR family transcriptional regulator n=1 Tax=Paenarthrobacter sp. DKR-5 TaxID=2835535 RepID=UPI001BDC85A5|nr:GntR family transcriptional regulator [Paenarthrobacter sp. DKR-5]MBT1004277.1 GntR family transcriptional regulator [Paenarthrobacter sp. DKR-5]